MIGQRSNTIPPSEEDLTGVTMCETKKKVLESAARAGKTSSTADMQTAQLVRNTLDWSPFLEGLILSVTALNGTVVLSGSCSYMALKRIATMIAYTVPGVRHVVDNIRIIPLPAP